MLAMVPFLTINGEVAIKSNTIYSIEQTDIGTRIFFRHKDGICSIDTLEPYAHCIRRLKTQYLIFTEENIQGEDLLEASAKSVSLDTFESSSDFRSERMV